MSANPRSPAGPRAAPLRVAVIMTGGTIAKSYDPVRARLANVEPKVTEIIAGLRLDDLRFTYVDLMHKDSLELEHADRDRIARAAIKACETFDAVLVTHGTDSMAETGELLCRMTDGVSKPVVFTGAIVPFSIRGSDAVQNVTGALLALRLVPAGVYIAFHNRILALPGAGKDHETMTFGED